MVLIFYVHMHLDESPLGETLVDLWSVGDILGPVCIVQGAEGLLQAALGWGDCGNNGGLGTATQGVLEDASQLALPAG